jgi:TetR/AcrR family transcriptional regulator, cholesterol catabolism regulator
MLRKIKCFVNNIFVAFSGVFLRQRNCLEIEHGSVYRIAWESKMASILSKKRKLSEFEEFIANRPVGCVILERSKKILDNKRVNKRVNSIAKAGAELFSKRGFAETSMEDIAAAAKLSKGGVYHYFSSKTDLLYYILDSFMNDVLENLQEELDGLDDKLEKVRRLIFRHVELYPKKIAEAKTLFHEVQNLPPKSFRKIVDRERQYYHMTAKVLSEYFGTTVNKSQVTAMTFILLGMCNSIYAWYNPKSSIRPEQLSKIIFDVVIDGVRGFGKKDTTKEKISKSRH